MILTRLKANLFIFFLTEKAFLRCWNLRRIDGNRTNEGVFVLILRTAKVK